MQVIEVDYVALLKQYEALSQNCSQVFEQLKGLSDDIGSLDIFWDGEASSLFITQVQTDIVDGQAIVLKLSSLFKNLRQCIEQYQETEKVVESLIKDG